MNNEKFCFSKTAGLMVLIGAALVVGAYFMGSLSSKSTSTSTRASVGGRSCEYGETQFADPSDSLKLGSVTYTVNSRGCILADGIIKDSARCSIVAGDFTDSPAKIDKAECPPTVTCKGVCEGYAGPYQVGACAPEGGMVCGCSEGRTYPTWTITKNPEACPVTEVPAKCSYGAEIVTNSTSPYKWISVRGTSGELKGKSIKCIADFNTGVNTGARCVTDLDGNISNSFSILDDESKANCPVPVECKGTCVGEEGKTYDIGAIEYKTFNEREGVREAMICQCSPGKTYPTWKTDTGPGSKLP